MGKFKVRVIRSSAPAATSLRYSGLDLVDLITEDRELGISSSPASSLVETPGVCL